jgi:hypothetical protein
LHRATGLSKWNTEDQQGKVAKTDLLEGTSCGFKTNKNLRIIMNLRNFFKFYWDRWKKTLFKDSKNNLMAVFWHKQPRMASS